MGCPETSDNIPDLNESSNSSRDVQETPYPSSKQHIRLEEIKCIEAWECKQPSWEELTRAIEQADCITSSDTKPGTVIPEENIADEVIWPNDVISDSAYDKLSPKLKGRYVILKYAGMLLRTFWVKTPEERSEIAQKNRSDAQYENSSEPEKNSNPYNTDNKENKGGWLKKILTPESKEEKKNPYYRNK